MESCGLYSATCFLIDRGNLEIHPPRVPFSRGTNLHPTGGSVDPLGGFHFSCCYKQGDHMQGDKSLSQGWHRFPGQAAVSGCACQRLVSSGFTSHSDNQSSRDDTLQTTSSLHCQLCHALNFSTWLICFHIFPLLPHWSVCPLLWLVACCLKCSTLRIRLRICSLHLLAPGSSTCI